MVVFRAACRWVGEGGVRGCVIHCNCTVISEMHVLTPGVDDRALFVSPTAPGIHSAPLPAL